MNYGERIRHPDGALNPPREKKGGGVNWRLLAGLVVVALIVVVILRPQWLQKIGVHIARGGGPGGASGLGFPAWRPQ